MKRRDRVVLGTACFIAASFLPLPGTADDATEIAELRRTSNAAIARHDAEGITSMFTEEYQITTGSGALFNDDPETERRLWQEIFDRYPDVRYVRTPDLIEVSRSNPRAFERGTWVGTWTADEGPVRATGAYAASWTRLDGAWKLRSELFVTLDCEGSGCP